MNEVTIGGATRAEQKHVSIAMASKKHAEALLRRK